MPSNLLNEREVAERLGIAVATLRVWRSTKRYNLDSELNTVMKYQKQMLLNY